MSDLIDRAALIKKLASLHNLPSGYGKDALIGRAIYIAQHIATVDAVSVVRCKDCKYKYYADNRVPNERCWVCDKSGEDIENMEWFCPYGEKEVDK